jgi:Domain of unknown function (DUF222)/HNH endonuclease
MATQGMAEHVTQPNRPAPDVQSFNARDWPLERLEREIGEFAAHVHAGTARWLALVAEFDRRDGWADWGCKSCAQWLSWQCALAPPAAREHVRVGRRLTELPLIRAAFSRGELSYSQVRALSRVATPQLEPSLLELARYSTAAQLERTLRSYRGVLRRELSSDEQIGGLRHVVCEYDEDGALLLRARLPAEEGALVVAALDAARHSLHARVGDAETESDSGAPGEDADRDAGHEPSSDDRGVSAETRTASNADALVLMAETLLASGPAERPGADNYQVVVHVDVDTLASDEPDDDAASQFDDGQWFHPETARRLACDASVIRILERDGRPLSVGRRTRSVPPALRRALQSRDRCCRFPGCTQRRFLHAHHIEHWAQGGRTDLSNLVHLCRFHHRLVHEGGYTLERTGTGGQLRFSRPDGRPLPPVARIASVQREGLERRNRARGVEVEPDTCLPRWAGERLDLALAIDALVAHDARLA